MSALHKTTKFVWNPQIKKMVKVVEGRAITFATQAKGSHWSSLMHAKS